MVPVSVVEVIIIKLIVITVLRSGLLSRVEKRLRNLVAYNVSLGGQLVQLNGLLPKSLGAALVEIAIVCLRNA